MGGACTLIGGGMLLFTIKKFIETIVFLRTSHKVEATVVSYKISRSRATSTQSSRTMYLPVLQFQAPGGKLVSITGTVASHPPAYNIGELAEVRYLPKNPHGAKINSFWEMWMLPVIFAFLAPALLVFAYVLFTQK